MEIWIDSDRTDLWTEYLRKKNVKTKEIVIDCAQVANGAELRKLVKNKLGLDDTCCGDSWDAIDDLLFEVVYPEKVILKNWDLACEIMSEDAKRLKYILAKRYEIRTGLGEAWFCDCRSQNDIEE